MAAKDLTTLRAQIVAAIATNTNKSITGDLLQTQLTDLLDSLAANSAALRSVGVFTTENFYPPATLYATFDTRNSVPVFDFDDATVESLILTGVVPIGIVLSSGLEVRLWWTATSATSGNVRWRVEFEKAGTDIDADSFDTATEISAACSATSGVPVCTVISATAIDSIAVGDLFRARISRVGIDSTNDTMAGDAELIAVEIRSVA